MKKFINLIVLAFIAVVASFAEPEVAIEKYYNNYIFACTYPAYVTNDRRGEEGFLVLCQSKMETEEININILYVLYFFDELDANIFVEEYKKCCSGLFYGRDTEYDQYIANNRIVNLLKKINFINPEFTDGDGEYFDAVVTAGVGEYY